MYVCARVSSGFCLLCAGVAGLLCVCSQISVVAKALDFSKSSDLAHISRASSGGAHEIQTETWISREGRIVPGRARARPPRAPAAGPPAGRAPPGFLFSKTGIYREVERDLLIITHVQCSKYASQLR